jgi:hypothetical protein
MPDKIPPDRPDFTSLNKIWNIAAAIIILTLLGHWLDVRQHTSVIFTLLGAMLAMVYCVYDAIKGK